MSSQPPPNCPRRTADGAPVACALVQCRYHCAQPPLRGAMPSRRRVVGDDCALAIASRGPQLQRVIAAALGVSTSAIANMERLVLLKIKKVNPDVWRQLIGIDRKARK